MWLVAWQWYLMAKLLKSLAVLACCCKGNDNWGQNNLENCTGDERGVAPESHDLSTLIGHCQKQALVYFANNMRVLLSRCSTSLT